MLTGYEATRELPLVLGAAWRTLRFRQRIPTPKMSEVFLQYISQGSPMAMESGWELGGNLDKVTDLSLCAQPLSLLCQESLDVLQLLFKFMALIFVRNMQHLEELRNLYEVFWNVNTFIFRSIITLFITHHKMSSHINEFISKLWNWTNHAIIFYNCIYMSTLQYGL